MMLVLKAWRESRSRFLLSALTLSALCAIFIYYRSTSQNPEVQRLTYQAYVWRVIYKGYLREMYLLLALFLGVGGLLRESDYGTVAFTLALPVSRLRHMVVRAGVGLMEIAAIAVIPAFVVPLVSPLIREVYPWPQAFQFALLWIVCGTVVFAEAFLCSVLFAGEYSAPIVAFVALVLYSLITHLAFVERYIGDLHDVMNGSNMPYFSADTGLIISTLPWTTMVIILLLALGFIVFSVGLTQRRDFS